MATPHANDTVGDRDLKYYIFDWDNNILHMPTRIHLEHRTDAGTWVPCSVSTELFSIIRTDTCNYRPPEGNWEKAFVEFRDICIEDENIFLRDTRRAIDLVMRGEARPAPSFLQFRQTLVEGRLFAIVTARGHDPRVIETGVRHFIEMVLSESERAAMLANLRGYLECYAQGHQLTSDSEVLGYYLGLNKYHGVMSPQFRTIAGSNKAGHVDTEAGKQFAIRDFVEHIMMISQALHLNRPISIGFSDDDVNNLLAVESYIRHQLAEEFPAVKFVVYDTSDPDIENGRKTIVSR